MSKFVAQALALGLEEAYAKQEGHKFAPKDQKDWIDPLAGPTGIVDDPQELYGVTSNTMMAIKRGADYLEKHYGGWIWQIQPDMRGGIVNIFSGRLSAQWGWRIRIQELELDYNNSLIKQAGGELLERFNMPRRSFHLCAEEYSKAPRDTNGQVIPEITGVKHALTRSMRIQEAIRANKASEVEIGGARFMRVE